MNLALIGLDTSHTVAFTELMQGPDAITQGLRATRCMRFPSPFQPETGQDARQIELEALGVNVTHSFEEAAEGAEGILLEINDPSLHLEYFEKAAELNLPIFLDKPMADTLENALTIYRMVQERDLQVWSSSALRFTPEVMSCAEKMPTPDLCGLYAPIGTAPSGSSLIWYGVHAIEILVTLMGCGAQSVFAREDAKGVVATIEYPDDRRGVVECNLNTGAYGGRLQNKDSVESFITAGSPYPHLMKLMEDFFVRGITPVALEDTLEVQSILEACQRSLTEGGPCKVPNHAAII